VGHIVSDIEMMSGRGLWVTLFLIMVIYSCGNCGSHSV
jgi:hypothetical protein